MFFLGAIIAVQEILLAQQENIAFERSLEGLSSDQMLAARARRAEYFKELKRDRQHAELCQAIRDSKPHGLGIFW